MYAEKVILEAVILTAVVVIALTLYTFWAARRGYDFNFLGPFLFGAVLVLMVFGLIQVLWSSKTIAVYVFITPFNGFGWILIMCSFLQVFFPLGKLSTMIYGCLAAIIFCGYILYDTDNLIKRYSYDEFIWASVSLYLDIINLFLSLLTIFRAADSWDPCNSAYILFCFLWGRVVFENRFLSSNKSLWLPCCPCF